jgi:PAS domain S-box-containing protein
MNASRKTAALSVHISPALPHAPRRLATLRLADLLNEQRGQITRQLEGLRLRSGMVASPWRAFALLDDLVASIRQGRVEAGSIPLVPAGFDPDDAAQEYRFLRVAVFEALESLREHLSMHDLGILTDWFVAGASRAAASQASASKAQNQQLNAMLDAVPDYFVLFDASSAVTYANRAARELAAGAIGVSQAEILGKRVPELGFPAEFVRETELTVAQVLSGVTVTRAMPFPWLTGGRWYEETLSPVSLADGTVQAIAMIGRDVHERRLAQTRLQLLSKVWALFGELEHKDILASLARLCIPELADLCIIDAVDGPELRRAQVAHRDPAKAELAAELLSFPPVRCSADPSGRAAIPSRSLLVPSLGQDMPSECSLGLEQWRLICQLAPRSMLIVPLIVEGETVAVATLLTTAESGRVLGPDDEVLADQLANRAALLVEKARLHQDLGKSEARFRVALASSDLVMFEQDAGLRFRWVYSPKHGGDVRDSFGKNAEDALAFEEAIQGMTRRHRVLETGERVQDELRVVLGGETRHFVVSFDPLRGAGNGITGVVGAAVDITNQRRVQEDLARELTFRERMMCVLSHDLRNPLSAVRMSADVLLRREGLPEAAQRNVLGIQRASARMQELIETLLDFTRSRAGGRVPLHVVSVDLVEVVRGVVEEARAARPGRALQLEARANARGRWDPSRMAQVVANLVGNALTHGAQDAPVRVAIDAEGEDVVLTIQNRGPVIPAELIPALFEPFRRGPAARTEGAPSGLGLGLYIALQIVQAHAGSISVESTLLHGTVFTVRLPRQQETAIGS